MKRQPLKSGYTTGTCAAAAAKAAAFFLLTGHLPENITVSLPAGGRAVLTPEPGEKEWSGFIRVQKDAGDDPDVTHGTWICASVRMITKADWRQLTEDGQGYHDKRYPGIYINGGEGIGIVTKRGLSCPVGRYAINPVPREMIGAAVLQVCSQCAYDGLLEVQIVIPEGRFLAAHTFNPRLGIEGGISVLGTTGIVEPMSEQALVETIRLDIRMKVLSGAAPVLITPGNYGEQFLLDSLGVPLGEAVKCSNFIADSMGMLVEEGAKDVLFAGHIGKLIKVTGGIRNTHSRHGDFRMELMARLTDTCAPELHEQVLHANTTEEVIGLLHDSKKAEEVLRQAAGLVKEQIQIWTGGLLSIEVVTFSSAYGILGMTDGVRRMLHFERNQEETT